MLRHTVIFGLVSWSLCISIGARGHSESELSAASYPGVAERISFFEKRINAKDADIRKRALEEIGAFNYQPEVEYVRFLKRMMHDPDECVRGRAIRMLYDMFVDIELSELPTVFCGYHDNQTVNQEDKETIASLISDCRRGGVRAGYAAYVLGLLRVTESVPALLPLAEKEHNVFVRYSVARALILMDKNEAALPILTTIIDEQERSYRDASVTVDRAPFYMIVACRALLKIERERAMSKLIHFYRTLDASEAPNDKSNLHYLRGVLAALSGEYFVTSGEAAKWFLTKKGN